MFSYIWSTGSAYCFALSKHTKSVLFYHEYGLFGSWYGMQYDIEVSFRDERDLYISPCVTIVRLAWFSQRHGCTNFTIGIGFSNHNTFQSLTWASWRLKWLPTRPFVQNFFSKIDFIYSGWEILLDFRAREVLSSYLHPNHMLVWVSAKFDNLTLSVH